MWIYQDRKASYDVNDDDDDPTPKYDQADENKWGEQMGYCCFIAIIIFCRLFYANQCMCLFFFRSISLPVYILRTQDCF